MDDIWSNLLPEILILILYKFEILDDWLRCTTCVCKSWRDSVGELEIPCLPAARTPFLILAEDVAPGTLFFDSEFHSDQDYSDVCDDEDYKFSSEEEENSDDEAGSNESVGVAGAEEDTGDDNTEEEYSDEEEDIGESEGGGDDIGSVGVVSGAEEDIHDDDPKEEDIDDSEEEGDDIGNVGVVAGAEEDDGGGDSGEDDGKVHEYNYLNSTIGTSRGLYSLLTGKTYIIDLPEAAGRLILSTNKGWLVTLGRDLKVNLLHPLSRQQRMLTFPRQYEYNEDFPPEEVFDYFIFKVVASSKISNKNTAASPSPIVLAIYGQFKCLAFARLGDKVWTEVKLPLPVVCRGIVYNHKGNFCDIAYHKGNFYAVDCHGGIFVCGNDDNEGGDIRGREIASLETKDWLDKYLVESSSGSCLMLLVRYRKQKYFNRPPHILTKYRTTNFSIWRLDLKYSNSLEDISCTLKKEKCLGNEAIFIGKASSVALSSLEGIKANSIYFTDDNWLSYNHIGGGHDMGIFNIEHGTIEPHFQRKSIHPISPPLWYF